MEPEEDKTMVVIHEDKTIYDDGTYSITVWGERIDRETGEPVSEKW